MYLKRCVLPAILLAAVPALCQTGRSTLTGTVVDAAGVSLQGAQITVDPGAQTTTTNSVGSYTLTGVPAGELTVTVTYSGFASATQKVTVAQGSAARADVTLKVQGSVQSVNVFAGRQGGEVEAINRTFTADNIINVLPADVITSLPNANIADAIGRLPSVTLERDEGEGKYVQVRGTEPRLTHTTLNGVTIASPETVRQIKLDLIPADLVESVQINKTLQANMEGDGIGGSVDIRTRSAGEVPYISLEATGGYTPIIGGRPVYQFDGTVGRRFLPGKKLGAIVSGSYDWNGRGINDIEPAPALQGTYDLRDYRYFRDRRGFAGTVDYRFSETSSIYLQGLYSLFHNYGDDWIYSPAINTFVGTSLTQGDVDGSTSFQALRRRPIQDIGGLQFGGHHVIGRSLFNWDLNSSVGRTRDDAYSDARFAPNAGSNPLNNVQYNLDLSNPLEPKLVVQNGVNIFDTSKYFFRYQNVNNFYNPEVDLGFGGSLAIPYTFAGHSSTFEFGGRFRNEHKFVNQNSVNLYSPLATISAAGKISYAEGPSVVLNNFLNDLNDPNYYGGDYKFGPGLEYDKIRGLAGQQDFGTAGGDVIGNSFNQREKVSAGYVMNTTELGKFRVILGLRIEGTNENNIGTTGGRNANSVGPKTVAQGSYVDLLPSAAVRYALTPASGVRLVYGRGLSRPNFSDLIPFGSLPSGGSARATSSIGNINLKAEYADNLDLLYENALPRAGLLQAGVFYKHFTDPIVGTTTVIPATGTTGINFLTQTINAGSAYVYGFEIAFQQHFTYLPGLFSGLGLSTNYGYTDSQATLPAYVDVKNPSLPPPPVGTVSGPFRGPAGNKAPLLRQSPNTFNISPTYDKRNLSVRLGMTYNQAEIYSYSYDGNSDPLGQGGSGGGINGPNGDTYLYSHLQIDLQGTYGLPKGFTVVAYGLNLNNEVFGFYQGSPIYPIQREFYKQTFGGGLRWSPVRNK